MLCNIYPTQFKFYFIFNYLLIKRVIYFRLLVSHSFSNFDMSFSSSEDNNYMLSCSYFFPQYNYNLFNIIITSSQLTSK